MKNNSKEVLVELKLPEFTKKDIDVKINKNKISIKAQKQKHKKVQKKGFYHKEKTFRSFQYFTTTPDINQKKAKISFKNNILKIIVPKKQK